MFVKFTDADGKELPWTLDGMSEPGLYPIIPEKGAWFLDKGRQHPVLRISRLQLPLAPAFAMTAHAAQGQTFKRGVIVDLRIGKGTSPMASYVALTRVMRREDMLIYRSFDREVFCKCGKDTRMEGPRLLLKHLRGEHIDWKAMEEEFMPRAMCHGCGVLHLNQRKSANTLTKMC